MAEPTDFDVYRGESGYVAVTNEVRRAILDALMKKERDLNALVRITGKAKPTLSNLHMKELLAQKLIEELPHPTDARRKIYRIKGTRIGSSSVPLDQLRGAVKQYVSSSPMAHALPLQQVFAVLLSAGPSGAEAIRRQAERLGEIAGQVMPPGDLRELLPHVAVYWEREGVSRTAKIDLEHLSLEVEALGPDSASKPALRTTAGLLAGFLQGVLQKHGVSRRVSGETLANGRVVLRVLG